MMTEHVLSNTPEHYVRMDNPIVVYGIQVKSLLMNLYDLSEEDASVALKRVIKNTGYKDPVVTFRHRKINGDREYVSSKLSEYLQYAKDHNHIMTPPLTMYDSSEDNPSVPSDFMHINIKLRKVDKANKFKYYLKGYKDKESFYETRQSIRKIFNNTMSGATLSKSTVLCNPSQHYSLTSITRCVSGIGNAVTESMVMGNKHFRNPDVLLNYIAAVLSKVHKNTVGRMIKKYDLHTPSVDELIDVLKKSSNKYWVDESVFLTVRRILTNSTTEDLVSLLYTNDLYQLRKFNDGLVREILTGLSARVCHIENPLSHLTRNMEGVNNLVHHICMDDIRGIDINYKSLVGTELLDILGATAANVTRVLRKYTTLLRIFFVTNLLPINISEIKTMLRETIPISDTDSTCGSYDDWCIWYTGNDQLTSTNVAVSASVMTIVTQCMDHNIKILSANMNIAKRDYHLLKMKNEFFWYMFTRANAAKHYWASMYVVEGKVPITPKLELKGNHFISGSSNQDIVAGIHDFMMELSSITASGKHLSPYECISKAIDLERELIVRLRTDYAVLKSGKVKSAASYSNKDVYKTDHYHHVIWEEVFAPKYGNAPEPEYATSNVSVVTTSKGKFKAFLDKIKDIELRDRLIAFMNKSGKPYLGTFRIPRIISSVNGIPEEILSIMDINKSVTSTLMPLYMLLESIGIYRKPDRLFIEMEINNV